MNKEELFINGNDAICDALDDAIIIINSKGDALTRSGNSDKMFFSPTIDCTADNSMMLFDTEDDAKRTIEDLLVPQDDGESFIAVKVSKFDPDSGEETTSEVSTDGETVTASKDGETEEYSLEDIISLLRGDEEGLDADITDTTDADDSVETDDSEKKTETDNEESEEDKKSESDEGKSEKTDKEDKDEKEDK